MNIEQNKVPLEFHCLRQLLFSPSALLALTTDDKLVNSIFSFELKFLSCSPMYLNAYLLSSTEHPTGIPNS